jgi:hypothetical protein
MTDIYTGALPIQVNLACYRGDTWAQQFRFLADGQPLDLSGYTFQSWCRSSSGELYVMAVVVESDPGTITLSIADWDAIGPGSHAYDIEAQHPAGQITTWLHGKLRVYRDVTNEVPNEYATA